MKPKIRYPYRVGALHAQWQSVFPGLIKLGVLGALSLILFYMGNNSAGALFGVIIIAWLTELVREDLARGTCNFILVPLYLAAIVVGINLGEGPGMIIGGVACAIFSVLFAVHYLSLSSAGVIDRRKAKRTYAASLLKIGIALGVLCAASAVVIFGFHRFSPLVLLAIVALVLILLFEPRETGLGLFEATTLWFEYNPPPSAPSIVAQSPVGNAFARKCITVVTVVLVAVAARHVPWYLWEQQIDDGLHVDVTELTDAIFTFPLLPKPDAEADGLSFNHFIFRLVLAGGFYISSPVIVPLVCGLLVAGPIVVSCRRMRGPRR